MSGLKLSFLCLCAVAAAVDVDYEEWKENKQDREYTVLVQPLFQGVVSSVDDCFGEVEGTKGAAIVQYHNDTNTCMLFKDFNITNENVTEVSTEYTLYFESDEKKEDGSITTGGIIATCIMVPIFLACLVGLAIVCKEEETDITAQMERLEQQELRKEEAVSEHWERKSHEAEAAAAKEMDAK